MGSTAAPHPELAAVTWRAALIPSPHPGHALQLVTFHGGSPTGSIQVPACGFGAVIYQRVGTVAGVVVYRPWARA